jgi:hypothetical protein
MSDTPEHSAHEPEHQPHADAPKEPPITIEQWLAAAPNLDAPDVTAKTELTGTEVPPPQIELAGQPVDVMPIADMTPITEQERANVVEGGADDFVPSDTVERVTVSDSTLSEATVSEPVVASEPAEEPVPVTPGEPTPRELSEMPPEPAIPIALPAAAAVIAAETVSDEAGEANPDQTSTDIFVHAHEDVESRRGPLAAGPITKFAGFAGLLGCAAGLAVLLTACAGFKSTGDVAVLKMVGNFQLLGFGYWIMWAGVCGVGLAIIGGFIEHRQLREETHVLGALFSNALAAIGGLLLWLAAIGYDMFGTAKAASGG